MASTPVPVTGLHPIISNWIALVKTHERIIVVGLAAFVLIHLGSKGLDSWVSHAQTKATQAATIVKTDDAATKAIQAQLTALQATVSTQNTILAKQIAQRTQTTQQQQTIDKTLPPADLASRWKALLGIANGIDPATGQQFTVSQSAAVSTLAQLEEVPTLTANNAALQTELTNEQSVNAKQTVLIGSLNKDLADEKKSHVEDVKLEKAKTKRAFLRGFKVGAVVGFIGGLFVGHF